MKIFIGAVAMFLALCTFVFINAKIVCTHTDQMIQLIEKLPKEPDQTLSGEIILFWNEHEDIFNLTTNHAVTDQIKIALYNLHNTHNAQELQSSRDTLLVMLRDLMESSSLKLSRII